MTAVADRNLLFGILAVQMDFISREALIAAMNAWVLEKTRPLGQILVAQHVLSAQRLELLDALVNEHLKQHGGDAQQSLRAVGSSHAGAAGLEQLADPEIQSSLAHLSSADEPPDPQPQRQRPEQTLPLSAVTSAGTRFRIIRPWREGGLGKVSVAQDEELHREVALKEIKPAQARNKQSRDRFLLEAEITGSLEHPGIVPVYGLGHYGDGRPFYAMRFVRGDSLEEAIERFYGQESGARSQDSESKSSRDSLQPADKSRRAADDVGRHSIAFRKLLGRFIDVCYAVDYAHSRGVLHRDLKPGNILLGKYGETLVVDWGLAKVLGKSEPRAPLIDEMPLEPHSGSGTAPTRMGALIGTPAFMSPEQATGRLDLLGPASDVYSLGATLYCVLTGQPPFANEVLTVVLKKVQDGNFPRPRQVTPQVPRPLEAVCLKAMSLHAEDRYASPRRLADDIERWLADGQVSAYREPPLERLRRWGRRHRALVTAAAALLITAVIALAVSTGLIAREQAETDRQRQEAVAAQQQSEAINKFLINNLLTVARPKGWEGGAGTGVTLNEALDQAEPKINAAFANQPALEAAVRDTIGVSNYYLGRFEVAASQLERALTLRRQALGPGHADTLASLHNLAMVRWKQDRIDQALSLCEQALEGRRRVLGRKHPDTLWSQQWWGLLLLQVDRLGEAETNLREATELCRQVLGPDHHYTLHGQHDLAIALRNLGRSQEAQSEFRAALEGRRRTLGVDHPDTLRTMGALAGFLSQSGDLDEAEQLSRQSLEGRRRVLGPDHIETMWAQRILGGLLYQKGQYAEAETVLRECLIGQEKNLAADHIDLVETLTPLGELLTDTGRSAEAEPLLRRGLEICRKKLPKNWRLPVAQSALASCLIAQRKYDESELLLASAREKLTALGAAVAPARVQKALDRTVHLYEAWGKPAEAARWREKTAAPKVAPRSETELPDR